MVGHCSFVFFFSSCQTSHSSHTLDVQKWFYFSIEWQVSILLDAIADINPVIFTVVKNIAWRHGSNDWIVKCLCIGLSSQEGVISMAHHNTKKRVKMIFIFFSLSGLLDYILKRRQMWCFLETQNIKITGKASCFTSLEDST